MDLFFQSFYIKNEAGLKTQNLRALKSLPSVLFTETKEESK